MEGNIKKRVRIATPKIVEIKKKSDNANDLLPEAKKRKRKENSGSKTKTIPKQENTEVPSLMSAITIIGDSVLKQKKRTAVSRRRLTEMTEPMRRLANAAERVFLPPKETNDRAKKVRFSIPPFEDKNELIIRPKEENDPSEHSNDETDTKRRRGRLTKHQVATPGSPSTRRSPDKPASARLKPGSDKKTSLSRRVRHDIDRGGETHQTPLDKNEPKQLDPRPRPPLPSPPPELPPPPQPWPAMSPAWLQSEPYIKPSTNVGSSSTNGANYKGKQVVVDDENDKRKKPSSENILDFLFRSPKGGIKIHGGSNGNANTEKESIPPRDRDFFRGFINELSGEKTNPIPIVQDGGNTRNPTKTGLLQISQKRDVKGKTHVSPSTYLRPAAVRGGSRLSTGGAATSTQPPPLTQGMHPPQRDFQPLRPWGGQSRLTRDFMTAVQEPPEPRRRWAVPDSHDLNIQRCAESIFGKEAFANGVPPPVGPFTAMMIIAMNHGGSDAMGALVFLRGWPPQPALTTTPHSHQFLPPPPPEELELASTSEQNLLCHNSWAPINGNQPPPAQITPPQHHQAPPPQFVTNPFLFNGNLFQQQSNLFMPTPQMAAFGVPNFPGQYLQGYVGSSSAEGNWVMGNCGYQGPPPPGF